MLSRDARIARYLFAIIFYLLSGLELVKGGLATISGTAGTICLASAILGYSPLVDYLENKRNNQKQHHN